MSEKWQKWEIVARKIVISVILIGAALTLFIFTPKFISLFLPFIVGYIISLIASPLMHIFEKLHIPPSVSAIISILLVAAALFGVSSLIIWKIASEIYSFSAGLPALYEQTLMTFADFQKEVYSILPPASVEYINTAIENIPTYLSGFSSTAIETLSNTTIAFLSNIPGILISFVFSVLASYFLIRDKKKVKGFISNALGDQLSGRIHEVKSYLYEAIFAYIKAQGILMCITFCEVFIGLSILGVEYSLLFALVIALVDAIPVFGTGTILIPWGIYHLIIGNFYVAIGLLALYGICLTVRQFIEPKILSTQIGMHPLLTLLSMYLGFRFIGIFGMILGPVVILIVKNIIKKYKELK